MNLATIHSLWTVLMFVLFLGIVVWAYSSRRKQQFDAAARMPLEDEDSLLPPLSPRGRGQGERGKPLIPTPSPSRGEGSEPSAQRATSFTRGGKQHG
jgi:cytochrome c oxidase cbb3-type subunit 4